MNNDKDLLSQIEIYKAQEKELQFDHFSNEDALQVGMKLIHYAKEKTTQ